MADGARAYAPDGSRAWRFAWRARPSQSVRSPAFGTGSRVAIRMSLCVREIASACARMRCVYKFEIARMAASISNRYTIRKKRTLRVRMLSVATTAALTAQYRVRTWYTRHPRPRARHVDARHIIHTASSADVGPRCMRRAKFSALRSSLAHLLTMPSNRCTDYWVLRAPI